MSTCVKDLDTAKLLSQFIDLLNTEGINSEKVKSFRDNYTSNKELVKLMDTAITVKEMFENGEVE